MTEVERIVSRAKRGRVIFTAAIAGLCLAAIAGAVFAIAVNIDQGTRLTKVERSACAKAPASEECQRVTRQADRNRSIADTCIAFWKVGYACPRPDSGITVRARERGDASQPAPAGQQPGSGDPELTAKPPKDGQTPADKGPGGHGDQAEDVPPAPTQPDSPETIDTPGKGNGPPADTPAAEAPGLVGGLTGPVGGAIDDVGKGVDKAFCPVADRLAGLCD